MIGSRLRGDGSIKQRRNRGGQLVWYIRWWQDGRGRHQSVAAALHKPPEKVTRQDAEKLLRERLKEKWSRTTPVAPKAGRLRVKELLAAYLKHLAFEEKKSLRGTSNEVLRIKAWIGDELVSALTYSRLEELAAELRQLTYLRGGRRQPYARGTVKSRMALLHAAFRYGEKVGLVPVTPRFPTVKADNPRQETISKPEYLKIRAALRPDDVDIDIVDFLYLTGWRISEVLSLTWDMVLSDPARIWLPTSKTGKGRLLPIVEPTMIQLLRWRRSLRRLDSPYVFHRDGRRVEYSGFNRRWMNACEQAGVPGKWCHDFRRGAYARYLAAGMDPQTARLLIGHASTATADRYNVGSMARLVEGLQKLGASENPRSTRASEASGEVSSPS
jgi:site-specific recombinase XerD